MFLTRVLLKKAKSKHVMVQVESVVSGHRINLIRERLAEKFEFVKFDPWTTIAKKPLFDVPIDFFWTTDYRAIHPILVAVSGITRSTGKFVQGKEENTQP